MSEFVLHRGREFPVIKVVLPCNHCGEEVPTVGIYLKAKAEELNRERNSAGGFWPSLSLRLCQKCLEKALSVFLPDLESKGLSLGNQP